jgi:subtilisin family serine protease
VQAFAPNYHADDRAAANPAAWNYLDRGVVGTVQTLENLHGFLADHVYSAAIRGFSARLTARQIQDLRNDSMVAYIEEDGPMDIVAQTTPWGIDRIDADISSTLAGNGTGAITNVNVYVIDTGVDISHPDLNVVGHVNFAGGPNKDCHGHGSHVAGTIAAKDNTQDVVGAAPGAPIMGVKVLGCGGSGTTSGVIKGVDFVTKNAVKPAIANMSLGGGASTALDSSVTNSAASGVFYSVAAGNSGVNACNSSPARAGAGNNGIVTTAAADSSNKEASWSNFGSCVDIWGPGVDILSTKKGGGTTTMSGTSMASPHTGGAGALYLSNNTTATPTTVEQTLKARATTPGTTSKDGSAIKLLNVSTF